MHYSQRLYKLVTNGTLNSAAIAMEDSHTLDI